MYLAPSTPPTPFPSISSEVCPTTLCVSSLYTWFMSLKHELKLRGHCSSAWLCSLAISLKQKLDGVTVCKCFRQGEHCFGVILRR